MKAPAIQLTLIPAPDEPMPEDLDKLRKELEALPLADVAFKRVGPGVPRNRRYKFTPPDLDKYITLVITPLATALGVWLHAHYGRKVRLKVGDIEAEAQTREEVEKLLVRAEEIQQRNQAPKIIP